MTELLSETEIRQQMARLPGDWLLEGSSIRCDRTFKNFVEAIAFVNRLVEPAELAGHHPDLAISYNKVRITLTTHDAGGLTIQDFNLAAQIAEL